eukprot:TRINITY_DN2504_c0_g1_i2.p1 TRINITY_DN2504_c0_g1~~TRINITY_DN2504_c0_g1_i2.p1  ORF type:complete len:770 (+),score=218.80 TRINITY_DN2504_c0_g1_i2:239-2548(+)
MYTRQRTQRVKKWEDGVLCVYSDRMVLKAVDSKVLSRAFRGRKRLVVDDRVDCGSFVVEIHAPLDAEEHDTGRVFMAACVAQPPSLLEAPVKRRRTEEAASESRDPLRPLLKPKMGTGGLGRPRAAPQAPVSAPEEAYMLAEDGRVWVEPVLARVLRPHQKDGVRFLFECCSGLRGYAGKGCILADEMGLGKTIQSISFMHTMLNTPSMHVNKVVVVTPSTLVLNWGREFKKWLGGCGRVQPVMLTARAKRDVVRSQIAGFACGRVANVLVLSYELCRSYEADLSHCKCDLLLCDEGHRLKGGPGTKVIAALKRFRTERRVLLTGTPVQNNLTEFFSLVDFVNPGLLGPRDCFNRLFVQPITRAREPNCAAAALKEGESRQAELRKLTDPFILRRTQQVISKSLPPKTDVFIFCGLSPLQERLYKGILRSQVTQAAVAEAKCGAPEALSCLVLLRKVLAHPVLMYRAGVAARARGTLPGAAAESESVVDREHQACLEHFPPGFSDMSVAPQDCGKMLVLLWLVRQWLTEGVKFVIVSNLTTSLDCISAVLKAESVPYVRLDGTTPSHQRVEMVDRFNAAAAADTSAFLLSSKAGGVGLNLVGACRLVLYDPDWNPANDIQAMARIWREGQRNPCRVYRLISRCTVEEKILQRQLVKLGLSRSTLADGVSVQSKWGREELRKLFVYVPAKPCETFKIDTDSFAGDLDGCPEDASVISSARAAKWNPITFAKCTSQEDIDHGELESGAQEGEEQESDLPDLEEEGEEEDDD